MKLFFFGTSSFSKPVFEALKKGGVKPRGGHAPLRGCSPILWDLEKGIEDFKKLNPDICVVAAYGRIIPKEYLEIPKYGFLNIHPSLLPKYRGASPIQSAILNDEKETGVTIILMDEKVDHGPTIANEKLKMKNEKYKELEKKLAELGTKLLIEILPKWINGEVKPTEQNHQEAIYTKKFSWQDGKIDWSKSADGIDRQIRALNPEPGTWTAWNNKILKILEVLPVSKKNGNFKNGQVFLVENRQTAIKCGFHSAVLLKTVQLEGKKPMEIKDFLNGRKDFIGSVLNSNY